MGNYRRSRWNPSRRMVRPRNLGRRRIRSTAGATSAVMSAKHLPSSAEKNHTFCFLARRAGDVSTSPIPRLLSALKIAVVTLAILSGPSLARDPDGLYNNSPYKKWFTEQHNEQGQWCCDQSDGHPYLDDYTMNQDGSVTLANGDKIEAFKVLKGSNPTGHAVAWFLDTDGGRTYY